MITAVVGMILNLAPFFGGHVPWPDGWTGRFDWISALFARGAAVALLATGRAWSW